MTKIPDGPASQYLKAAAAISALLTALTAVLHGDHQPETIAAGLAAGAFLVTFAAGKYAQATAREHRGALTQAAAAAQGYHPVPPMTSWTNVPTATWSSTIVTPKSDEISADGPGDNFDGVPHVPAENPADVPTDGVDHV